MRAVFRQDLRNALAPQPAFHELAPEIVILPAEADLVVASDRRPGGCANERQRIDVIAGDEFHRIEVETADDVAARPKLLDVRKDESRIRSLDCFEATRGARR